MRSIAVYCGSSAGARESYTGAARSLAEALVARGIRLVYGGASVGLMGVVADTMIESGGEVIGVIPKALVEREVAHHGLTEPVVTEGIHERKLRMMELADGFVALPGGIGTLDELFEVWTWAQLGLHDQPLGLLDVGGYYDDLVRFLDRARDEAFLKPAHRDMLLVERDPVRLLDAMGRWQAPVVTKWIERPDA